MRKLGVILILALFFSGCRAPVSAGPLPVVKTITITQVNTSPESVMAFTTDQQTTAVLNYLRMLDIRGEATVNPEYVAGPMYEFTLTRSDGSATILRQKGDRYFMDATGQWLQIEPYSGARLGRILEK